MLHFIKENASWKMLLKEKKRGNKKAGNRHNWKNKSKNKNKSKSESKNKNKQK